MPGYDENLDFLRRDDKTRKKQFEDVVGHAEDYDVSLIEPPLNQARKIVN